MFVSATLAVSGCRLGASTATRKVALPPVAPISVTATPVATLAAISADEGLPVVLALRTGSGRPHSGSRHSTGSTNSQYSYFGQRRITLEAGGEGTSSQCDGSSVLAELEALSPVRSLVVKAAPGSTWRVIVQSGHTPMG